MNLLSNALKYTQRGGFVKIIVDVLSNQKVSLENSINNLINQNKYLSILVWDNGHGIS